MAKSGQMLKHIVHPMQSSCRKGTLLPSVSRSWNTFLGQTMTQRPHALHSLSSTDTSNLPRTITSWFTFNEVNPTSLYVSFFNITLTLKKPTIKTVWPVPKGRTRLWISCWFRKPFPFPIPQPRIKSAWCWFKKTLSIFPPSNPHKLCLAFPGRQ